MKCMLSLSTSGKAILTIAFICLAAFTALTIGFGVSGSEVGEKALLVYAPDKERIPPPRKRAIEYDSIKGAEAGQQVDYSSNVEELLQLPEMPSGCEPTSLTIVLNAMGFEIGKEQLVEGYIDLDYTWTDPTCFLGSPYTGGGAFPPAIVEAANEFLEANGETPTAVDITGTSMEEVLEIADSGTPVLVWTTMYMASPSFTGQQIGEYSWYTNEHCVVVYGTSENGDVLVSDPLEGLVERDLEAFTQIYDACGQMAARVS